MRRSGRVFAFLFGWGLQSKSKGHLQSQGISNCSFPYVLAQQHATSAISLGLNLHICDYIVPAILLMARMLHGSHSPMCTICTTWLAKLLTIQAKLYPIVYYVMDSSQVANTRSCCVVKIPTFCNVWYTIYIHIQIYSIRMYIHSIPVDVILKSSGPNSLPEKRFHFSKPE